MEDVKEKIGLSEPVSRYINRKRCHNFVSDLDLVDSSKCKCGYIFSEHTERAQSFKLSVQSHWSRDSDIRDIPTDSYGKIKFNECESTEAQHVRMAFDTPMENVVRLLYSHWKMERPNALISILGTSECLNTAKREAISRSLVEAAVSMKAWIVTGGLTKGLAKIVGEAVKNFGSGEVPAIGVTDWGSLDNKHFLFGEDVTSEYPSLGESAERSVLEPNHTHFLLIDDGTRNNSGEEITFRSNLLEEIGQQERGTQNYEHASKRETVPVYYFVIGGGADSLDAASRALKRNIPIVVVKGSGGTADVLAYAYHNTTEGKTSEDRARVMELLQECYGHNHESYLQLVEECVKNKRFLSVFDLEMNLFSHFQQLHEKTSTMSTADGSMVDILNVKKIIRDDYRWRPGQFEDLILSAIRHNHVDIVKLFYTHGFSLQRFLRLDTLLGLYTQCSSMFPTTKWRPVDSLETFYDELGNLIGKSYLPEYKTYDRDGRGSTSSVIIEIADAAHELFIFATLMNYFELSQIFLAETKGSIIARALFGQTILVNMRAMRGNQTENISQIDCNLKPSIDGYERIAVELLDDCYKMDEKKTNELLVKNMKSLKKTSCVVLAQRIGNTSFFSHPAFWHCYKTAMYGCIDTNIKLLLIMICTLIPPLVPFFITFTKGARLFSFYTSPIVKFYLNIYSCLVFLGLYTFVLLVKLSEDFYWQEFILFAWVFTFFGEELEQFFHTYYYKSKFKDYFSDAWNWLDLFNIILFVIGYVLKYFAQMDAARIVLCVNFITFTFKLLRIFSFSKRFGPFLSMIYGMMTEFLKMLVILVVFILSYAVASEAILYPEAKISLRMLYNLPRKAYWQFNGEFFLEDIEGDSPCTDDPTLYEDAGQLRCPSDVGQYAVPILLGIFILLADKVLLTVLIAILSGKYEEYSKGAALAWNKMMFRSAIEYRELPVLPHPFSSIYYVFVVTKIMVCVACCCFCCGQLLDRKEDNKHMIKSFCVDLYDFMDKELIQWEFEIVQNYFKVQEQEHKKRDQNEMKCVVKTIDREVKSVMEKVDTLSLQLNNLQDDLKATLREITSHKHGMMSSTLRENHAREESKPTESKETSSSFVISSKTIEVSSSQREEKNSQGQRQRSQSLPEVDL